MSWHSKTVAVTGAIGAGKSTVCKLLADKGCFVVSADELARDSLRKSSPGLEATVALFGDKILDANGQLNRQALGKIVFGSKNAKAQLEAITHPIIAELAAKKFATQPTDAAFGVYDVPLLFEAGLDSHGFAATVCVTADEQHIIDRLTQGRGMSEEEVRRRLASQLPQTEKAARANHVIENNGSFAALQEQVDALFSTLQAATIHTP